MSKAARAGKTIALGGFLLGCLGAFFPLLSEYRGFNGIECALLFLNRNESLPEFFLLAAFFLASGLGLVLCLRTASPLLIIVPALIAAASGSWAFSLQGFRLFALGWAAFGGALLQIAGSAVYAIAPRDRRS